MSPAFARLLPALVAASTFAAFSPALGNPFINWDDRANFQTNPHFGSGLEQLRWIFTGFHLGHWQPLSWLSLSLDHWLWGPGPFGIHLTNILLHCANALLVMRLARVLSASEPQAAFAALFFSLHPLRAESVAWATERRDVLSGFFYLSSVLFYLKGRRGASFAAFAAAILSKVTAATLPVALLVLDVYPLRRKPTLRDKLPFFLLALAVGTVGLLAQQTASVLTGLEARGPGERLLQSLFAPGFYLLKTLLPIELSVWYDFTWLTPPRLALGIGLFLASAAWAWRERSSRPALLAGLACVVVCLGPSLGLIQSGRQAVACRFAYMASVPLALGFGWLCARVRVMALALPVLAVLAWDQASAWGDPVMLWSRAARLNPRSDLARQNLAIAYFDSGRDREALALLEGQTNQNHHLIGALAAAYSNVGVDLAQAGRLEEAVAHFEKSLRLAPELAETHRNAATVLKALGRGKQADKHFKEHLRLREKQARK